MIMHSADFLATSIGRTPLFDHVTLSAKRREQSLVLPSAKSGLSAKLLSVLMPTDVCYWVVVTCLSQVCRPSSLHLKKIGLHPPPDHSHRAAGRGLFWLA